MLEHSLRRGARRAGRWYATGLHAKDFNGVFGYQARRTSPRLQHALCALPVSDIKAVATAHVLSTQCSRVTMADFRTSMLR